MKRDGDLESVWQESTPDIKPVNAWRRDEVYDVLIVGGGITGLTTALLLQSEGKKCILAEAENISFGTTGGTTAHLNTLLDVPYNIIEKGFGEDGAKLVAAASREAIDLIEGLITRYDIDCEFSYQTGYLIAETKDEAIELEKIKDATARAGVVIEWSENVPTPLKYIKACRVELQGKFHPGRYISGLAKAFEEKGGVILQNCLAGKVTHGAHIVTETLMGEIHSEKLVYATHIPPGFNLLHFRCAPYRSYAAAFTLKSGDYPDGLVYDMKDPYHYFRSQTIDGKQYIIGGGFDHKTGHKENTEETVRELEAYIREHYDIESIDYKWSSQYFNSTDGLPYIGLLPGAEHTYVGTGYGGNGMVFGTLAAKMICELITNKESRYEKIFAPDRIKPIAGFTEFVKENADVMSQFISLRFSYQKIKDLVELAPGEAVLANWNGKKLALYKDENGKVYALDPVCPHAKCIVAWNSAEKSWDCPCHGSRFACDGHLLTGPSIKGLTPMLWEDFEGD